MAATKKAFFYLVTFIEYGIPVWKWGIKPEVKELQPMWA